MNTDEHRSDMNAEASKPVLPKCISVKLNRSRESDRQPYRGSSVFIGG
jgi:hypothetical protein